MLISINVILIFLVSTVGEEGKFKTDLSIYFLTQMCSLVVYKYIFKPKNWDQFE
jgi:hypothetical protein